MILLSNLFLNLASSIIKVALGVSLGFILAIILAGIRYFSPERIKNNFLLSFLFEFFKYPPPIAWIPIIVLFFGIGFLSPIIVVFSAAFPPALSIIYDELCRIKKSYKNLSANLELNTYTMIRKIYLKGLLPKFFTALRVSVGMGWMSIIAAEMLGGGFGIGAMIQYHRLNLDYHLIYLDIFTIGCTGFLFQKIICKIESRLIRWKTI